NNLNRCPAPSSVVDAWPARADRLPERVKSVPVPGPAWAAGHRDLARAANVVDPNAVGRQSNVATFAGHNNKSEVWQIGLLRWKPPSTEGESLVSLEVSRSC